jgi:hypothetical protein
VLLVNVEAKKPKGDSDGEGEKRHDRKPSLDGGERKKKREEKQDEDKIVKISDLSTFKLSDSENDKILRRILEIKNKFDNEQDDKRKKSAFLLKDFDFFKPSREKPSNGNLNIC